MSKASSKADTRIESWLERRQHWIAVLVSALLHLLFLFLMMLSSRITVTPPQGTAGGGRMVVDFIGATPPQPKRTPPAKPAARRPAAKPPAKSRVQSTLVAQAEDPLPPEADALTTEAPTPVPPDAADDAALDQAQAPDSAPPPTPRRRPRIWGQPPGMLPENLAPENAGMARSPAIGRGRRNDAALSAPSMEVDGYQVYYDQRSETRLRAWRDQGMTEIFLPLPGTRRYMVCPLETALKRESGPCRLLEPDSPELKAIGDAREVINMQQVYRLGEKVWSGPGPYR